MLRDFLRDDNGIAFGLDHCGELVKKYGWLPPVLDVAEPVYPAMSFAAQGPALMVASS